jgi:hypothetical protein
MIPEKVTVAMEVLIHANTYANVELLKQAEKIILDYLKGDK